MGNSKENTFPDVKGLLIIVMLRVYHYCSPLKLLWSNISCIGWIIHIFWLVRTHDVLGDWWIDDITIYNVLFVYRIEQIDPMLLRVCTVTVIDYRRCQNAVGTSVTHSAAPCVLIVLFFPHFGITYDLLLLQMHNNVESVC